MNKFKVGDKVKITKRNLNGSDYGKNETHWDSSMDEFDGTIQTIKELGVLKNRYKMEDADGWTFDEDWLDLLEDDFSKRVSGLAKANDSVFVDHSKIQELKLYKQSYSFGSWELKEPIRKKTMLQKLSDTLKRVLNKDMQAQYKAGYRDGGLALTETGMQALIELLAIEKETELADKAREHIAEEEK